MDCGSTITIESILPTLCARFEEGYAYAIAAEAASQAIASTPVVCDGRSTMELLLESIMDGPKIRMAATQNPVEDFITCDTTGISLEECIRRCITYDEFGNVAIRVVLSETGEAAAEVACDQDIAEVPLETMLRLLFVRATGSEDIWLRVTLTTSIPSIPECSTGYPPLETLVRSLWGGTGLYIYYA